MTAGESRSDAAIDDFGLSPIATLWGLTEPKSAYDAEPWLARVASVTLAAVVAWGGLSLMARRAR